MSIQNDNNFKSGDVVRLNSGGPDMTIKSISGHQVSCVYFHGGDFTSVEFASYRVLTKVK